MTLQQTYSDNFLRICVSEEEDAHLVHWYGNSTQKNPNQFIIPILIEVLKKAGWERKKVVLDFRELEYMNSSTLTPIIKALEQAKRAANQVQVIYDKAKRWQDLSFSALRIFETKDGRIKIMGAL
ncbi:MAG: hypothetical protein JNM63_05690 [Spirochaetia bacterium]|nr:hypothetical protein [Spirochaetia bacterium]